MEKISRRLVIAAVGLSFVIAGCATTSHSRRPASAEEDEVWLLFMRSDQDPQMIHFLSCPKSNGTFEHQKNCTDIGDPEGYNALEILIVQSRMVDNGFYVPDYPHHTIDHHPIIDASCRLAPMLGGAVLLPLLAVPVPGGGPVGSGIGHGVCQAVPRLADMIEIRNLSEKTKSQYEMRYDMLADAQRATDNPEDEFGFDKTNPNYEFTHLDTADFARALGDEFGKLREDETKGKFNHALTVFTASAREHGKSKTIRYLYQFEGAGGEGALVQ